MGCEEGYKNVNFLAFSLIKVGFYLFNLLTAGTDTPLFPLELFQGEFFPLSFHWM